MCTVTYIPRGNREYLLTSNRDENSQRSSETFSSRQLNGQEILFPVDPVSGGSWIVVSDSARIGCILNGAFEKHHHDPPYARSRGLVLLDYIQSENIKNFVSQYQFEDIEPFTLIACEQMKLWEFRWDGAKSHLVPCDPGRTHIWSSSTLYDETAKNLRNEWFNEWLSQCPNPGIQDLFHFLRFGGTQDRQIGFVMNRQDRVQTLSITAINKMHAHADVHHHNLIQNQISQHRIDFSENEVVESL